ncbi:MAG: MMPL family transporter [Thermohalobaculum sp.]|nr:MMPL family transporter [Thermohalobaculum sp.]
MTGLRAAFLLAACLAGLAVATLRIETDIRALTGVEASLEAPLDIPEGRTLVLAVVHPDREARSALARAIVHDLAGDPMVAHASTGAMPPPAGLSDQLWAARFVLAPPPPDAFAPEALAAEFARARAALTSMGSSGLAHAYLLDPTGSFRRLIEALTPAAGSGLPHHRGVTQARDDSAALVMITLAERPFDAAAQRAFDLALAARVEAAGAEALLVGPRTIAARISAETERSSTLVAAVGGGLLLLWLAVLLRSAGAIARLLLPLVLGLACAGLVVQAVFGGVHVVALGFGGALMGLAMDYPLHLHAHRGTAADLARTRRLVLLGAATTAVAFLSLLGAGVPAIAQVGVFVATGLSAAALPTVVLGAPGGAARPVTTALPQRRATRWKIPALALLGAGGAAAVLALPGPGARGYVALPPAVTDAIAALDRMMDLPSGRHRIEVEASTLAHLLARERQVAGVLADARAAGWVGRAALLAQTLPEPGTAPLPAPAAFAAALAQALPRTGLKPAFASEVLAAYRDGLARLEPDAAAPGPLDTLMGQAGLLRVEGGRLIASVRLWDVAAPTRLSDAVATIEGARMIDHEAALAANFGRLTARVLACFGVGFVACTILLACAVRRLRAVAEIMVSVLGATAVTAAAVALAGGGIGLFELMALALVVGIGIDYGIFLTLSASDGEDGQAVRSVMLCAMTTLIAFLTMALLGSGVLRDIGMTVSIGVIATGLAAHLRQRWPLQPGA